MMMKKKKGPEDLLGPCHLHYFVFDAAGFVSAVKWIANLGVVPLFLFAAFLLAPAFFAFLSLLFVVTHVLETIGPLLYACNFHYRVNTRHACELINRNFKPSFLPIFNLCVKGFFIFFVLTSPPLWGEDFILARGESLSLPLPRLKKFNIANKEIVAYQFNEKNKTLLLRGTKLGSTEFLVWEEGPLPVKHHLFVISKQQEAHLLHLAQNMGELGLETKLKLPHLEVKGDIKTLNQYLQFKKLQSLHPDTIFDETHLHLALRNDILASIYQLFFNEYKDSIKCEALHSEITCSYPANERPHESLKNYLLKKYRVNFIEYSNQKLRSNYSFKMKLIQLEQLDGEELRLGLEQLNSTLKDIFSIPLTKIIEKNSLILAQKKVQMNTLAEPMGLLRPLTPAEFQIGADIPYKSIDKEGSALTQWQFAGLKVKIVIENVGDKIQVNYQTELTRPEGEGSGPISGNKEQSSVVIPLGQPTQVFQISLKTTAKNTDQMPFLNRIPLLGELFKSKSSQENYKMITGIIEVKGHE